jgi:hypothetical protein
MVTHQRLYEHAMVCDGVVIDEPQTYYEFKGRTYAKGQEVLLQRRRPDNWLSKKEVIKGEMNA